MEGESVIKEIFENELRNRNLGLEHYLIIYKKDFGTPRHRDIFYYLVPMWKTASSEYLERYIDFYKKLLDVTFESEMERTNQTLERLMKKYDEYIEDLLQIVKDLRLKFSYGVEENSVSMLFEILLRGPFKVFSVEELGLREIASAMFCNRTRIEFQINFNKERIEKEILLKTHAHNIRSHFRREGFFKLSEVYAIILSQKEVEYNEEKYIKLKDFERLVETSAGKIVCMLYDNFFTPIYTMSFKQDEYLEIMKCKIIKKDPLTLIQYDLRKI